MGYENCGRKSKYREAKRDSVIGKAWDIVEQYFDSKAKITHKIDRALKLLGITEKTQVEHSGNLNLTWTDILNGFGKSNSVRAEDNSGKVQASA